MIFNNQMQPDHSRQSGSHNHQVSKIMEQIIGLIIQSLQDQDIQSADANQTSPNKKIDDKGQDQISIDAYGNHGGHPSHSVGQPNNQNFCAHAIEGIHQTDPENIQDQLCPTQQSERQGADACQQHQEA